MGLSGAGNTHERRTDRVFFELVSLRFQSCRYPVDLALSVGHLAFLANHTSAATRSSRYLLIEWTRAASGGSKLRSISRTYSRTLLIWSSSLINFTASVSLLMGAPSRPGPHAPYGCAPLRVDGSTTR